jgi:hypothetical protein
MWKKIADGAQKNLQIYREIWGPCPDNEIQKLGKKKNLIPNRSD